jgi:hypothetical protein
VGPKRPKTDRNPSGSRTDKPFFVASRPTAKPACDYAKRPEVKALPASPSNPAEVISAAARGAIIDGYPRPHEWRRAAIVELRKLGIDL